MQSVGKRRPGFAEMKIAIIGGGVSGLVAGYKLHEAHEVTLFEKADRIGGHTNTVDVEEEGVTIPVDTGFIVFNDRTYPNFIELLSELGVESQPTRMTFSVSCEETGLEYRGADLGGLFAQKKNLVSSKFLRLLMDMLKFNKLGHQLLESDTEGETVDEFFARHKFSNHFMKQYFMPMGAAIWSSSFETFRKFPVRFIAEFYKNHGLLGVSDRPQWRVIKGGSRSYIKPLTQRWKDRIRLNQSVEKITRLENCVTIFSNGQPHVFDHLIFACHSDQALNVLGEAATETERQILSAFPYQQNVATLHTQESVLPRNRRAWACWNYYNPKGETNKANVTYNMNMLQSLESKHVYCVTLNDEGRIHPENVIKTINYAHPTFGSKRKVMQDRHQELINHHATSYCGAYWGNGFHEDGVASAIRVVRRLEATTNA
jgi:predicted NAD/FAD-binding protein